MKLSAFIFAAAAIAIPASSQAHFLWISLDAKAQPVVQFAEVPGEDPLPLAERGSLVKAFGQPSEMLSLKADANRLVATGSQSSAIAELNYGVVDRSAQGRGVFWLYYYAKAAATPQASQTIYGTPLEVTASIGADGKPVLTVLQNSKPAAGAEVAVALPTADAAFTAKSDADGHVTLPSALSGPLAVRAMLVEQTKGTEGGKSYDFIRRYASLTVGAIEGRGQTLSASVGGSAPAGEPLTRQLSKAFGNNHMVVSQTAFINLVMDNKLTRDEFEAHLQQRALVHDAIHKILVAADPAKVPYGPDQKQVLTLLFGDLMQINSDWPKDSQAWPLTKSFIQEIQDSAKKGPYFALGVMHVYYGGITHGGRDIGAMIGDKLKISPNYYLKSDGYDEYAKRVNQITDPEAQKEMIRGGVEAYKYIIASNNDPFFKK